MATTSLNPGATYSWHEAQCAISPSTGWRNRANRPPLAENEAKRTASSPQPAPCCRATGVPLCIDIAKELGMNDRIASPPEVAATPATAVVPRTHVNSAMKQAYVPNNDAPARPGSDDHKRFASKGNPT